MLDQEFIFFTAATEFLKERGVKYKTYIVNHHPTIITKSQEIDFVSNRFITTPIFVDKYGLRWKKRKSNHRHYPDVSSPKFR